MTEERKNEREGKSRREWVKNAAIIFLAVMLVLTLFSNSFMNYSLPEVSTQYVIPGTITKKVRGTGTISSSDPYAVVLNESRVINSVRVKVGDTVEKGDVILLLEESESEELKAAEKQLEQLENAYQSGVISGNIPAEDVYTAQNGTGGSFAENLAKLSQLEGQAEARKRQIADYDAQILNAQNQRDTASRNMGVEYSEEYLNYIKEGLQLADTYEACAGDLAEAKTALDTAQKNLAEARMRGDSEEEIEQLERQVSEAQAGVNAAAEAEKTAGEAREKAGFWIQAQKVLGDYNNQIIALEEAKKSAEADLNSLNEKITEFRTSSANIQSLSEQLREINEQRETVEKLKKKESSTEVTAPVSGTITALGYRAGETAEAGSTVASIQVSGKECTMSISVTADQAKALSVGDVADIQNGWYYDGVTAAISAIRTDPNSPKTNRLIVFTVEGPVMDGQSLSVSVGQKSAEYDLTVPNSAVREDNNGKFVLIVTSKQSPLGTRYTASRVDVEVLASDEKSTAVSAALNGYEYVITTASKPVEPGQLVRLAE